MTNDDKRRFWSMVNVCAELYKRPELSKEAIVIWYEKLAKFDFNIVSKSFDKWTNDNKTMPTPADIIDLCKSEESKHIPVMIGRKFTQEQKDANHRKLQEVLAQLNIKRIA
jgi:hypothetical protein